MVPGDGSLPCDYCAKHGTVLCPLCDVVSVHAATPHAALVHEVAPLSLCETCHAARRANHRASLCTPCAFSAWYNALARILHVDAWLEMPPRAPPTTALQEPAETWLPDLVNVDAQAAGLPGSSSRSCDEQDTMMNEASSLIQTGGNIESQVDAGGLAAAALLPAGSGEGDASVFTHDDLHWFLDDAAGAGRLDDFNFSDDSSFIAQGPNLKNSFSVEPQAAAWSLSSGHDDPWPLKPSSSYCSETVTQSSSDHGTESLAGNSSAFGLSNSAMCPAANTSTSVIPAALGGSPPAVVHQDQHAPLQQAALSEPKQASRASQDLEARAKLQEKRQEAKQRYMEKKKNRRFDKRIRYVSRKVIAEKRNRVSGRFA